MSRTPIRLLVLLAAMFTAIALAVPAQAAAPYCGITWGSLPEQRRRHRSAAPLTNARAGRHACFDRLVIDMTASIGLSGALRQRGPEPRARVPRSSRCGAGPSCRSTVQSMATSRPAMPNVHRLHDVPPGRLGRQLRGLQHRRARRPGAAALPGLPAPGPYLVVDVAHRW